MAPALAAAAGEADGEAAAGLEGREGWRCGITAAAEVEAGPLSMGITRGWALGCCCWRGCCCWLAGAPGAALGAWQEGHAGSAWEEGREGGRDTMVSVEEPKHGRVPPLLLP